jgi:hypothetical protein
VVEGQGRISRSSYLIEVQTFKTTTAESCFAPESAGALDFVGGPKLAAHTRRPKVRSREDLVCTASLTRSVQDAVCRSASPTYQRIERDLDWIKLILENLNCVSVVEW